jgi:hypothetical protein
MVRRKMPAIGAGILLEADLTCLKTRGWRPVYKVSHAYSLQALGQSARNLRARTFRVR